MAISIESQARGQQIRDVVTEAYLETGRCLDVQGIATLLKWSESKVRRVLDECRGCPDGLHARQEHRESKSKNYTWVTTGAHRVWVYEPALWYLRDMILAERAKTSSAPQGTNPCVRCGRQLDEDGECPVWCGQ